MQKVEMNPYVVQIDKFANSLDKLSRTFLKSEVNREMITDEGLQKLCEDVKEKVCKSCERRKICNTKKLLIEMLHTVEDYGAELNVEVKRKIQKKCCFSPQFLKTVLEIYQNEKRDQMWKRRIAQNREGCAVQLNAFAQMIRHSTKELDASIFEDEHLEKKIKTRFLKVGLKTLSTVFLVTENGRYEIHVTAKVSKGQCVTSKEVAKILSECTGRNMVVGAGERAMIGMEYGTISYVERAKYHTLQGVAKIGKGCDKISGDNFSMLELAGGKQGVILSDGMGAGQAAHQESALVVEVLEELLNAGFPKDTALQMVNNAMVMGREEVKFSTIDMAQYDLYTGKCELAKAGASITFIKRKDKVEIIKSTSLPIGVVSKVDIDYTECQLSDGDMVIMVTDGVMDALPVGEQELLMQMIIQGTSLNNPKELAHHILGQVLECSGEVPMDDMTVVVVGIWSLEK